MDNQQLNFFSREQLQVFLTSQLGDGCIITTNSNSTYYSTNCKYKDYIDFKSSLLGDLFKRQESYLNKGYKEAIIYGMRSKSTKQLNYIKKLSLGEILNNLDDLGLSLWFYDDGSLHQKKLFYNLSTHKFSKKEHEDILVPFFNKWGIFPVIRTEVKKDGRKFYYLCIGKYNGANIISEILSRYPVESYSYKRWSSETIQKWSKMQEHLKSSDREYSKRELGNLWRTL